MRIPVELGVTDIANNLDEHDALELIKAIDIAQVDWDFTYKACKYFMEQMKALVGDDPEYGEPYIEDMKGILE